MKRFKCKECGYIHIGDEPAITCPVCGFDSEVFYEMQDNSNPQDSGYIEMIEDAGNNTIKLLRQKFDSTTELAAISLAMSKQASYESKEDDKIFRELSLILLENAASTAMMLGEFLEFNTESNLANLVVKLKKIIDKNNEIINSLSDDGIDECIESIKKENEGYSDIFEKFNRG